MLSTKNNKPEKCEIEGADCGRFRVHYNEKVYCEVHCPFKAFMKQLTRPKQRK